MTARWARFGKRATLPTETRDSADRPGGYKVARLLAGSASDPASFFGLTVGGRYASEDTAVCEVLTGGLPPPRRWGRRTSPTPHAAPELACTCGFYAYKDRAEAADLLAARPPVSRLFGTALLEVDFAGTVIEFDRGYRAGHQRVLGVHVPPWCVPCAANGRARRAVRLAGLAGAQLESALQGEVPRLPTAYRLALTVHHATLLDRLAGRAALRPVCHTHSGVLDPHDLAAPPPTMTIELADLASRLATEVRWLHDDLFDVAGFVEAVSWLPPAHRGIA
jgi:hypothetical protein